LNSHDIDSKFNTFLNIFLTLFEASFPTKTQKKVFENNEWITKGIKTSCRYKRELYLNCRSSDNQIMKIHYRKYCRILTQVIKEAKRLHYNKQLLESDNKVKVVWKILKKETGKVSKEDVTPAIKINYNVIKNPKIIAHSFNTYFLTIVERMNNDTITLTREDTTKFLTEAIPKNFPSINLMPTTANEIRSIIHSLKSKSLCGYDEISTTLLESCADYICLPLSYLCNQSMAAGVFPEQLKYSKVKLLYKKGEKSCISNYRPISLLPAFSKIFEKVMYKRVSDLLNLNNIFAGEQFGFRKNLSTDKALFTFTEEMLSALNNKMHVGGISCDITKAFDCINYELLLSKLNFYGIRNIAGQWFKSYLHDRKQ
jgi:hypothetical protein